MAHVSTFKDLCARLLREGTRVRFTAYGRSMYPTMRDKDIITVEPVLPSEVRRGDITLYRLNTSMIAHHVLKVTRPRSSSARITIGPDTWGRPTETIGADKVLGRVIQVERGGVKLDPYSPRATLRLKIHKLASHLKRLLHIKVPSFSADKSRPSRP
ncbi:MAG: hypothetical protein JRH06_05135 [Deltaproteobacteria bacterium]|nr:hypothetical protein [Deltaproteobacteria bacterium]MBW2136920.1 hypothetical protein [Deltaproteobacteria bacterium]